MTSPVTAVYLHAVWATLHREPTLSSATDDRVCSVLVSQAASLACHVVATGCARDHVHVLVQIPSPQDIGTLVGRMKGASSHVLNRLPDAPRRFRWQSGYWVGSVNPKALSLVAAYVTNQRAKHEGQQIREAWERARRR